MVKRICALLAVIMAAAQLSVYAGELYKTQTRQIYCFSDIMRAYVDIEDRNSDPVSKPDRSSVIGYIDGTKLTTSSVNRFGDTNEGVASIFLVDISGSLNNDQMHKVREAIKAWAEGIGKNDRMAVMTFGNDVSTLTDFTDDKNAINSAVDRITNSDVSTRLYGGIDEALRLATRDDKSLPKRRNIMLITDGLNDYEGGISENDIYSELQSSLIPVYSMWMPGRGPGMDTGRATLNSVADYSGGTLYDMSDKDINTVYGWIKNNIENSFVADFSYGGAAADNSAHTFKIRVAEGGKVAEDSVQFTMNKTDEESGTYKIDSTAAQDESEGDDTESDNMIWYIILGAAILVLLAAAAVIFIILRRRKNRDEEDYYEMPPQQNFGQAENNFFPSYNLPRAPESAGTVQMDFTSGPENSANVGIKISLNSASGKNYSAMLSDKITIGRSGKCNISLSAPTVSGTHASVLLRNGKLYIEDLGSVNGTLVNGRLVTSPTELKSGDYIMFGGEEYRITF